MVGREIRRPLRCIAMTQAGGTRESTGPRLNRRAFCVDPVRISWLFLPIKRTVRHHRLRPLNQAPVAERLDRAPASKDGETGAAIFLHNTLVGQD